MLSYIKLCHCNKFMNILTILFKPFTFEKKWTLCPQIKFDSVRYACFVTFMLLWLFHLTALCQNQEIEKFNSISDISPSLYESVTLPAEYQGKMLRLKSTVDLSGLIFQPDTILGIGADGNLKEVFIKVDHSIKGRQYRAGSILFFNEKGRIFAAMKPSSPILFISDEDKQIFPPLPDPVGSTTRQWKWQCSDIRPWQPRDLELTNIEQLSSRTLKSLPISDADYFVYSKYPNNNLSLVKLFKNYKFGELTLPVDSVLHFNNEGNIEAVYVSKPTQISNFEVPDGSILLYRGFEKLQFIMASKSIEIMSFRTKPYTMTSFFPTGSLLSLILSEPVNYKNNLLPSESLVSLDNSGNIDRVTYSNDLVLSNVPIKGLESVCYNYDGTLGNVTTSKPYKIAGNTFPTDTTLVLDNEGKVVRAMLREDVLLRGLWFKSGTWVRFYGDGSIETGVLAKDAVINGIAIQAVPLQITLSGIQTVPTRLHEDGSLWMGRLLQNSDIKGFPCKGGTDVELDDEGTPVLATFYAPFTIEGSTYQAGKTYNGYVEKIDSILVLEKNDVADLLNKTKEDIKKILEEKIASQKEHFPFATIDKIDNSTSEFEIVSPNHIKFKFAWRVEDMLENVPLASDCDCDCGIEINLKWRVNERRDMLVANLENIPVNDIKIHCPGCPAHNLAMGLGRFFVLFSVIPGRDILSKNISPRVDTRVKALFDAIKSDPTVIGSPSIKDVYLQDGALFFSYKYLKTNRN